MISYLLVGCFKLVLLRKSWRKVDSWGRGVDLLGLDSGILEEGMLEVQVTYPLRRRSALDCSEAMMFQRLRFRTSKSQES